MKTSVAETAMLLIIRSVIIRRSRNIRAVLLFLNICLKLKALLDFRFCENTVEMANEMLRPVKAESILFFFPCTC